MGSTYKSRRGWEPHPRYPASPNAHCHPGTLELPPSPNLRAKTTFVNSSTHRMLRCPPHTAKQKQLHIAMYGKRKSDWTGVLGHAGSSFNREMQRAAAEAAAEMAATDAEGTNLASPRSA